MKIFEPASSQIGKGEPDIGITFVSSSNCTVKKFKPIKYSQSSPCRMYDTISTHLKHLYHRPGEAGAQYTHVRCTRTCAIFDIEEGILSLTNRPISFLSFVDTVPDRPFIADPECLVSPFGTGTINQVHLV